MHQFALRLFPLILLAVAVPARAADSVALPEGPSFMLFGLGVAGVIIGRRLAIRRDRDDDDRKDG
jgi:hypothetical protein